MALNFSDLYLLKLQNSSERDNSILAVMQRNGLNTMTDLLKKSGVANNLTSSGPFTVFAITDAGFNELRLKAPTWYNTFTTNMTVAAAVLPNYIVNGRVPRTAILPDVFVRAQGGIIYFDSVDNGKVFYSNLHEKLIILIFTIEEDGCQW